MSEHTEPRIMVACDVTWPAARPCTAWGSPSAHGCKHEPGHTLRHRCLCGAYKPVAGPVGDCDE